MRPCPAGSATMRAGSCRRPRFTAGATPVVVAARPQLQEVGFVLSTAAASNLGANFALNAAKELKEGMIESSKELSVASANLGVEAAKEMKELGTLAAKEMKELGTLFIVGWIVVSIINKPTRGDGQGGRSELPLLREP
eukprot:tig00000900_g5368.t1